MTTAGTSTASALCTGPNHCHAGRASVSRSPLSVGFHPFERPPTRPPLQMQGAIRPGGSGVVRRTRGKTGCEPGRSAAGLTNPVTMNAKASIARRCSWLERGHGVCFSPRRTPHSTHTRARGEADATQDSGDDLTRNQIRPRCSLNCYLCLGLAPPVGTHRVTRRLQWCVVCPSDCVRV